MPGTRTLAIIKPDAFARGLAGKILAHLAADGFRLHAARVLRLSQAQAAAFYEVHRERPFFAQLTTFMSSGPAVVLALEKEGAVRAWRDLIGAADPAKADEGRLRKEFANSIGENPVHGSDSEENAQTELAYVFSRLEFV